jgi:flagellar hook-associated protein 1
MSITGALSNALSGLTMAGRASELVSTNVANAMTPGYARRELNIGARVLGTHGQGVTVNGVDRVVDRALLSDRRMADAGAGGPPWRGITQGCRGQSAHRAARRR